jgi:hypothetical protein
MPLAVPRNLKGVSGKQKPTFKKPTKPLEITLVVPFKEYERWIDFKVAQDEVRAVMIHLRQGLTEKLVTTGFWAVYPYENL